MSYIDRGRPVYSRRAVDLQSTALLLRYTMNILQFYMKIIHIKSIEQEKKILPKRA